MVATVRDVPDGTHAVIPLPTTSGTSVPLTSASRPSSQLSQNGSSGYGSTRSQVAPFSTNHWAALPSNKSPSASSESSESSVHSTASDTKQLATWGGSMRGYNRRIEEAMTKARQNYPQFSSLRIPSRVRHHLRRPGTANGDIPSSVMEEEEEFDPGLDLIEAEVDSMGGIEDNNNRKMAGDQSQQQQLDEHGNPVPAPRMPREKPCYMNMPYPLRPAQSVDGMQVSP